MPIVKACLLIFTTFFLPGILFGQTIEPPYKIIVYGSGYYMSPTNGAGITVNIYLNNLSNDTLVYKNDPGKNNIFKLSPNVYFEVAGYGFENKQNLKDTIPPHRSQKIKLLLKTKKRPINNVLLVVTMALRKEINGSQQIAVNLSDSVTLFYCNGGLCSGPDTAEVDSKKKLILPDRDIYLLTAEDRKVYTLIADTQNISLPHDTSVYVFKIRKCQKYKTVTIPVSLKNASDKTLKFWSMSCSWEDSYSFNNKHILCALQPCEKNVPTVISVAPHRVYKRYLKVVYDNTVEHGMKCKLSFSLIKATKKNLKIWDFPVNEYVGLNKISTDDISIR